MKKITSLLFIALFYAFHLNALPKVETLLIKNNIISAAIVPINGFELDQYDREVFEVIISSPSNAKVVKNYCETRWKKYTESQEGIIKLIRLWVRLTTLKSLIAKNKNISPDIKNDIQPVIIKFIEEIIDKPYSHKEMAVKFTQEYVIDRKK